MPRLLQAVPGGQWIRLYSFDREVVLNAQLQTIVSLQDYAAAAKDAAAAALADQLLASATSLLPRFDTGYWSLYELGGPEADLNYQSYVVQLLRILDRRVDDPTISKYANAFASDLVEPPLVRATVTPSVLYPWPADGFRDSASVSLWLSKRSTVKLAGAGPSIGPVVLARGWHALTLRPGPLRPGSYVPTAQATDVAGNASTTTLPPVDIRRDTQPPTITARLRATTLSWSGSDDASPWLRLTLVLRRNGERLAYPLGRRAFSGSVRLKLPRTIWNATLASFDSSGNRTDTDLGLVGSRG